MGVSRKRNRASTVDTARKKRMGRPKEYQESWTKKLVVLRLCGLNLDGILRLLHLQSGQNTTAKARRSQQLVKSLLGETNKRFRAPDEETARTRAAFLRTALRRNARAPSKRNSLPSADPPSAANTLKLPPPFHVDNISRPSRSHDCEGAHPEATNLCEPKTEDGHDAHTLGPYTASGTSDRRFRNHSSSILMDATTCTSPVNSRVSFCSRKSFDSASSMVHLRRWSHSSVNSSFVSDLISLMGRRFSLSTIDTFDRYSVTAFSEPDADDESLDHRARKVLAFREQRNIKENKALIERCCSRSRDCIHRLIEEIAELGHRSPSSVNASPLRISLEQRLVHDRGTRPLMDLHKYDTLFFAARVGAPVDVLLSLVAWWVPKDTFVDADGQTFLHSLDTRLFEAGDGGLYADGLHASSFERLIRSLGPVFDLDRLDNHGRHFLFYLCSLPSFDLNWLLWMMRRYPEWEQRVARVSQIRDRAGLFLFDHMALHPEFWNLGEEIRSQFQPHFVEHVAQKRLLTDEDEQGRTDLHNYIQKDFLEPQAPTTLPFPSEVLASEINKYDDHGRTPIMSLAESAFERDLDDDDLCVKVKQLVLGGANINACSRSGTTILLFAARKAYPKLLDMLISLGARTDHCDDKGQDALAHAAKTIHISQTSKRPVELLARSFKSAAKLLSVDPGPFRKTSKSPSPADLSAAERDARSKRTLQKLLAHVESENRASSSSTPRRSRQISP